MRKRIILFVLFLLVTATVFVKAQSTVSASNVLKSQNNFQRPRGFLDYLLSSPKFSMSQSYSISYFSVGRQGFSQGLYLNTMNYRVQRAMLNYRPSDKISFTIDYQVMPSYLYSPYYYRW